MDNIGWTPPTGETPPWDFTSFGENLFSSFADLISGLTGRTATKERARAAVEPQRGQDVTVPLTIDLEDAYFGAVKRVTVSIEEPCPSCSGKGGRPTICPVCQGTGVATQRRSIFSFGVSCNRCRGEGTVLESRCRSCSGTGKVPVTRTVEVRIPPGVRMGSKLRLQGQGASGLNGGPKGDLYLEINIRPHPFFERKDDDLYCEVPLTFSEAALGAEIQVPTIDRWVRVTVPPGTQPGQMLRLPQMGMPRLNGGRGDLYVRIKVVVPKDLTTRERQLIQELAMERSENPRARLWHPRRDGRSEAW